MSTISRILIVDDHAGARAWLERAARAAVSNCQIATAANIAGAMLAFEQPQPSLPQLPHID